MLSLIKYLEKRICISSGFVGHRSHYTQLIFQTLLQKENNRNEYDIKVDLWFDGQERSVSLSIHPISAKHESTWNLESYACHAKNNKIEGTSREQYTMPQHNLRFQMRLKINRPEARTGPKNFQLDLSFIYCKVQGHLLLTNLNQVSSTNIWAGCWFKKKAKLLTHQCRLDLFLQLFSLW